MTFFLLNAQKNPLYVSIQPQYGYVLKHSARLNYLNTTTPYGVELSAAWHLISDSIYNTYGLNPKVGSYISVINFNHETLGITIPVGIFVEPFFKYGKKITTKLKAGVGIAYTSKPYDSITNPLNVAYSLKITGHAFIGIGFNYNISEKYTVGLISSWHHFSNGAIKEPNKGINIPSVIFNFDYCINPAKNLSREKLTEQYKKHTRYELVIFEAKKTDAHLEKKFDIYGVWVNYSRQVSRINAVTLGSEFIVNTFIREYINRIPEATGDHKRINVLIGHEFIIGKVIFSQNIGIYVYCPYDAMDPVYQRYGLSYHFKNGIIIGTNLKAHRHVGDFIDFRLGYSFVK